MEINAEIRTYKTAGLKRWIPYIGLVLIIVVGYKLLKTNKSADPIVVPTKADSVFAVDTSNKQLIDSLKNFTIAAVKQIHKYEQLKKEYESQEAEIRYKPIVDSSAIIALRSKLSAANNEISRLNGELAMIESKRNIQPVKEVPTYTQPAIITPDENSLIIHLDGKSKRGNITIPENLTIYLIPYSKELKREMSYDLSCSEFINESPAKYYNGLYFFNSVQPGKYFIKICTYVGNFKLIDKQMGKQTITMQISPPVQ